MKNWAIVPVKPFVRAKSRLATVLSAEQRTVLAEEMFRHSLGVLTDHTSITGVSVLSRDAKALAIARQYGARTIQESGIPSLNASLYRASEIVRLEGWEGLLILPADLPLITPEDIEQICHAGRYQMTVVIAPDRNEDNTNALFVRPVGLIPFSFGPGSFQRHIELAQKVGATTQIFRSKQIELDVDTPADLDLYRKIGSGDICPTLMDELTGLKTRGEGIAWNRDLEYG